MFKYVKAILIIILLVLGAQLVSGQTPTDSLAVVETAEIIEEAVAEDASLSSYEEFQSSPAFVKFIVDNLWVLLSAFLVFIMHLGFASVESGMNAAKNTVNVIYKNIFTLCAGIITYAIIGFALMYPGDFNIIPGVLGFAGFGIGFDAATPADYLTTNYHGSYTIWTDFLFQAMFAATAATIISGAVAGRIKMPAYMLYAALIVTFAYPITGSWQWGGGWLSELGFHDFAGSTLVHAVGGAAALVAAWVLGPRIGRYGADGKVNEMQGHSFPLATIGVFLLWFGWFGFNGGSVLSADPAAISLVLVNTALAAAAGSLAAMATATFTVHKLDAPQALNGILAGLVGITAGADAVMPGQSIVIGAIAGILVVLAVIGIDKLKIDDPVSAIAVHLVCGVWGTLAAGIWGEGKDFMAQLIGTSSVVAFTIVFALIAVFIVKFTLGLRSDESVELIGADVSYHGNSAYPDFAPAKHG
jgi:Amt family ammonium transporter